MDLKSKLYTIKIVNTIWNILFGFLVECLNKLFVFPFLEIKTFLVKTRVHCCTQEKKKCRNPVSAFSECLCESEALHKQRTLVNIFAIL